MSHSAFSKCFYLVFSLIAFFFYHSESITQGSNTKATDTDQTGLQLELQELSSIT